MQETLDAILDFLDHVWDICYTIFEGLFNFFDLLATLPVKLIAFLGFFPAEILTLIMGLISIVIIYKLVGRT